MKRTARKILLVVLAMIFAGGAGRVLWQVRDYRLAAALYDKAQEIAVQNTESPMSSPVVYQDDLAAPVGEQAPEEEIWEPLDEDALFLTRLDLAALRETNEDVLGWVHIPDSAVSYPLIRAADNQEYLRRAWDGSYNQVGCIFLECKNSGNFNDFNTIIYGHYMNDGTMFGSLHDYKNQDYWDTHPYVYVVTDDTVRRYQVFSAYEAGVTEDTYRLYFENDARKESALKFYTGSSVTESAVMPGANDRILTLSTCTELAAVQTRWVVQYVLTGEFDRN